MIEKAGGEAVLIDAATADRVQGRTVVIVPSATRPGAESAAARRLRSMGVQVAVVGSELLRGDLDLVGFLETAESNGRRVDLPLLAAVAFEKARASARRATAEPHNEGPTVQLVRGADISPEPVDWIWRYFLARGKLHMIAGATGAGKTTIATSMAATVSGGGRWPDGTRAEVGNVLMWSGEDDVKDTLLPRLLIQGANRSRLYFVGDVLADGKARPFDPSRDMPALEREAARIGDVRLLIVDPIVNAVAGDSHKNTETRRALQPIVDLAARLGAAALGVSHFSKATAGREPVERVTGSVAFGALPRVIFAVARATDENALARRLFVRVKSNIGPDGGGFGYDLKQAELPGFPGVIASRVLWGQALDGTARDLLAIVETTEDREERGVLDEVADWLTDLLHGEGGEIDKREIIRLARENGFSERTVHRARGRIGAQVRTTGFGKEKRSRWRLPQDANCANCAKPATHKSAGTIGTIEGEV